ncbi:MAG: mechanosensitive ion channel family protein, partial [Thermodesulfobacteriota bacterium]
MLPKVVEITFFQNRVLDYIIFVAIIVFGFIVIKIAKATVLASVKRWSQKTATTLDDFLIHTFEKSVLPLLYYGVFYLGTRSLILHPTLSKAIDVIGIILLTFLGIRFLSALIEYTIKHFWLREAEGPKVSSFKGLLPALKILIWGLGIIFLLDNLGFKISTVIAGLGIGGIAVAMASQAILGDLFSYFAILFDRPFELGDFIIVDDYMGSVEHIGIKTTRIRSLGGEQLVFSNTDLTNSRVRNYKRMEKRRVVFSLGVTYDTSLEQLKEIPGIIRSAITGLTGTAFDRAHFSSYGDFSLNFEVVYYILSGDYNRYMDIQQEINFAIKEEFEKRGIEFAFPTQTL